MADKPKPTHVLALIKKHTKPKPAVKPERQVIPAATLWNRLRRRGQD